MQSGVDVFAVANVQEASEIREMGSDKPILILGPLLEDEDEALIFQRSQLLLEDSVSFVGTLPFLSVLDEIRSADVLLLPSLEEGIANVVLEAMALGTLVVSTDCGGMSEVVIDKETGFLVPTRGVKDIANTIKIISCPNIAEVIIFELLL